MKMPIRFKTFVCILALFSATSHLSLATAAPDAQLVTCVNLNSGKERISHTGSCRTTQEAVAKWHLAQTDSALASGSATKSLLLCSYQESSNFSYRQGRTSCPNRYKSTLYTRSSALPTTPVITQVSSNSYESASLALSSDSATNIDAPIAYYTITSSKGDVKKVYSWRELTVTTSGLQSSTSYTFTITATSVDGTSPVSASSLSVNTQVYVARVAASTSTPAIGPAFTLSASAESKTVNFSITGYTITSTGSSIASYAISPAAPTGVTFNTSTGLLSGSPTSTQSATSYTVTATNATGSAARSFILTVTASLIGTTGPGGGIIFYEAATPFACGPTLVLSCSYLEAAPTSGTNNWTDATYTWSGNTASALTTISTAIGSGYKNTLAMISQSSTALRAGTISQAYRGPNNLTDWYLPSKDELNQMCKWQRGVAWTSDATVCSGGASNSGPGAAGFVAVGFGINYWSSSQDETVAFGAWYQWFDLGNQGDGGGKGNSWNVRPIRAF